MLFTSLFANDTYVYIYQGFFYQLAIVTPPLAQIEIRPVGLVGRFVIEMAFGSKGCEREQKQEERICLKLMMGCRPPVASNTHPKAMLALVVT